MILDSILIFSFHLKFAKSLITFSSFPWETKATPSYKKFHLMNLLSHKVNH